MKERRTTLAARAHRGIRRRMNCSIEALKAWVEDKLLPEPNSGCFLWTGSVASSGYGDFTWRGKRLTVHRFMLEQAEGPLLPGEHALHKCDNRLCARPSHLFKGTAKDNSRDALRKGRLNLDGMKLMQTPGVPHAPYRTR